MKRGFVASLAFLSLLFVFASAKVFPSRNMNSFQKNSTERPVIGIVTQPLNEETTSWADADQYINAGYARWIQSAGGIAIAIPHTATDEELRKLFYKVNGIVFPGGGTDLFDNRYRAALDVLYDEAVKMNAQKKNDMSFPLWGTCLGFEYLAIRGNNGARDTLGEFLANNISLPVKPAKGLLSSRLFSYAHPIERNLMIDHMSKAPSTANMHYYGISPNLWFTSRHMSVNFDMLGTSIGQDGKEFVAIMESPKYPFFGVQFHPERSMFEWADKENIVKGYETIRLQHYFGTVLVLESHKNNHAFQSREEENRWNLNAFPTKMIFGPSKWDEEDQGYYFFKHDDFPLETLTSESKLN